MDELNKIPELFNELSNNLDSKSLSTYCKSSKSIHEMCQSDQVWLNNINARFGIEMNTIEAYSMLLEFMECDYVGYMNVTLYDEKAANRDKIVTILGKILVKSYDTIGEILEQLDKKFGILGDIAVAEVLKPNKFTDKRYSIGEYYIEYEGCDGCEEGIRVTGYLLHHDAKPKVGWLNHSLDMVIPRLSISNMDLVFVKHDYSDKELEKIRRVITESLEN